METAKVDVRKLQLLNDRICQTIDALNQVRLSVHGLQHAAGAQTYAPIAFSSPAYVTTDPRLAAASQQAAWGGGIGQVQAAAPVVQMPVVGGLSHSTAFTPIAVPFAGAQIPLMGLSSGVAQTADLLNPDVARLADPFWAQRISQVFPYLFNTNPGVLTL